MKRILIIIAMAIGPILALAQPGTTTPYRWVGTGIWDVTPPSSYQPTNGVFHIDTVANRFWIHKGGGFYEELDYGGGGGGLWTDEGTHIYRNSPVSVSNNSIFSFLYDFTVEDVNADGKVWVQLTNNVSNNDAEFTVSSGGNSPISLKSYGNTAPGTTIGEGNAGVSELNGGTTLNILATQGIHFGVPGTSAQPAFSITNGNILKDSQGSTGATGQFFGNVSGVPDWGIPQSNNGNITNIEAGWDITNRLFIETTDTDNSHPLPSTWTGQEGDVMTFVNKSSVSKDITGDIDNSPTSTLTVVAGETVQFVWDANNTTWWSL